MDTQHPSATAPAPSADPDAEPAITHDAHRSHHSYGVTHANSRHTTRFTVVGNHLAQHAELSLLAIGLAVHIQSLPTGARVDIKTLTARFPEGSARISGALRELEAHGYLRRVRERVPGGRIVTRTVSCNQPAATRRPPDRLVPVRPRPPGRPPAAPRAADDAPVRPPRREPAPLHVPQPGFPAPSLLQTAADLLAGLHHTDPRLLLSARDAEQLAPGVAAWLEREAGPAAVQHALTTGLPADVLRHPARLLAHRLTAGLPPPPPFRTPLRTLPLQNCEHCDRAFRAPEPGVCRDCRTTTKHRHREESDGQLTA
ncbi:helix-turn-helix domain-containing protein [Streptomyces jumonjinensis]|uniref:Helix-turn-helix domain-containing protein n=1 Tax=Streptomyces jumonjinensis TaxID=1945 RepID=A0A646KPP0_STRJU|nr:helix-turn-helix domain-containing protein [Streptomyces jumonjinensis]